MDINTNTIQTIEGLLAKIEMDIKKVRIIVDKIKNGNEDFDELEDNYKIQDLASKLLNYDEDNTVKVIEGVYDGYFMIGSDSKKYPVPLNYSSKTKLIPGDVLKLRIMEDGKLIYKLIGPSPRKFIKATLSQTEDSKYTAITDEGNIFYLNQAAVTFFKGKPGDELSIIVNSEGTGTYAAIEAVISN